MAQKSLQIDEQTMTPRVFRIPIINAQLQEPYFSPQCLRQQMSSRFHYQKFLEQCNNRGNQTNREHTKFEPLKIEKVNKSKRVDEKSISPNKIKIMNDIKLKGLLNIVQSRCTPKIIKFIESPQSIQSNNIKKIKFNFQRTNTKFPSKILLQQEDIDLVNKKFLINTFRKPQNQQVEQPDISRPVRSKSDVERTRSKSNLKSSSPTKELVADDNFKRKTVRFNEQVEIRMFDRVKSNQLKQLI